MTICFRTDKGDLSLITTTGVPYGPLTGPKSTLWLWNCAEGNTCGTQVNQVMHTPTQEHPWGFRELSEAHLKACALLLGD